MTFILIASFPDSLLGFRGALIDMLLARSLQVHVAAPDLPSNSPIRIELEAKGVLVHDIPLRRTGINPLIDLGTLLHLWRLLRAVRPDFVMGYTIKPVIYGSLAAWLARVPKRFALITGLGYTFQSPDDTNRKQKLLRTLAQSLYRLALHTTHKVFFQNPDDEALFRNLGILQAKTPSVVMNGSGVDIATYHPEPLPPTANFLLIARLLGDKGIREYAQSAKSIHNTHPEVIFNIAGWIDDNPNAIKQHELDGWINEGVINYLGRLSDVRPAIASCSVYVLPSYREGTPRTVLEAMAMGRPIITTDAPGCRETVIQNENGYLIPPKSVDALTNAMLQFINDPGLIQRMGKRSREIAEIKYDVHKVNTVMLHEMGIS